MQASQELATDAPASFPRKRESIKASQGLATTITFFFLLFSFHCLADELPPVLEEGRIIFSFESEEAQSIFIAGSMNSWLNNDNGKLVNPDISFQLTDPEPDHIWTVSVKLDPGKYDYKYVVDGAWTPDGDNLSLEVYKDRDGNLKIKEKLQKSNTKYSSKIFFGGKLIFQMPYRYDREDGGWAVRSSSNCIDIDFFASPVENIKGFFRTSINSANDKYYLDFSKGHIDVETEAVNIYAFYNERLIQFDDPLKLFSRDIFLRQDKIELVNETNENRRFGLGAQGVIFNTAIAGVRALVFYADDSNYDVSNSMGLRLKKESDRLVLGIAVKGEKGKPGYPYTDPYSQFPDPESPAGLWDPRAGNLWFRQPGLNDFFYAADFSFKLLPFLKVYAEYGAGNKELSARFTNEGWFHNPELTSPDTRYKIYKKWDLYSYNVFTGGLTVNSESGVNMEMGVVAENYRMSKLLGSVSPVLTRLLVKFRKEFGKNDLGLELNYNKPGDPNQQPEQYIFFDPYSVIIWLPSNIRVSAEESIIFKQVITLNILDSLTGKLAGKMTNSSVKINSKTFAANSAEFSANVSFAFSKRFEFLTEGRVYSMNVEQYNISATNISGFAGLSYNLSKDVKMLIGYGLYSIPVSSEDEADNRYSYLFEEFITATKTDRLGQIRTDNIENIRAIKEAENKLGNDRRIIVRAEMKF